MTNLDAMLAAVVANPHHDIPRIMYADACEEAGDDARAEFVRLQLELATPAKCEWETIDRHTCPQYNARPGREYRVNVFCPTCSRVERLHRRERELLGMHWHGWSGDVPLRNVNSVLFCANLYPHEPCPTPHITFRRGFVEEIHATSTDWRDHGPALVQRCPITRVTTEKRPSYDNEVGWGWYWREIKPVASDELPTDIWKLLDCPEFTDGDSWKWYVTEQAALDALSNALIRWARHAAKLPDLMETTR